MTFDVANRLTDAHGAIANTQTLVSACASVGYQHPDLTAHGAQIAEWFGSDDGLDLGVLDADCDRLHAALTMADEAMRLEDAAAQGLNSAWSGASGSAAAEFIASHRRTAFTLVELVRSAADGCTSLRDALWRIVDTKVAAAITIDDRRAGERTAWLAAARTVMSGGQDRSPAVEIIEKAVVPYVDSDIRIDWIDAMRSARDSVGRAYREALNQSCRSTAIDFDLPGPLVPLPTGSRSSVAVPQLCERDSQPGWSSPSEREPRIVPAHVGNVAAVPVPEPSPANPPTTTPPTTTPPTTTPPTTTPPITGTSPFASPAPGGFSSGLSEVPNFDGLQQGGPDPSLLPFGSIGEPDPKTDLSVDDPNRSNADSPAGSEDQSANRDRHAESEEAAADDEQAADDDDQAAADRDDDQGANDDDQAAADDDEHAEGDSNAQGGQSATSEGPQQANPPIAEQEHGPPPTGEPDSGRDDELPDARTPCEIAADELPQVGQ